MTDPREMQAGAELDAAIAVEVLGWQWVRSLTGLRRFLAPSLSESDKPASGEEVISHATLPAFSSDPSASAELRAKLWELGFDSRITWWKFLSSRDEVEVSIEPHGYQADEPFALVNIAIVRDDPRPAEFLAVARCALEAARKRKGAK